MRLLNNERIDTFSVFIIYIHKYLHLKNKFMWEVQ